MSRPDNPRFPHTCVIWRLSNEGPLEDQDTEYDPLADESDSTEDSGDPAEEETKVIIYEGECRAYEKNTTSDKGDIISSYRGLALPLTRDDWTSLGVVPEEGDLLVVDRGCSKEYGSVLDKNPGNFGGTHLTWRYGRN